MMSLDARAKEFSNRTHIRFVDAVANGEDYEEQHVRVATVHTREDIALLCFLSRQTIQVLWIIAGLLVANLVLLFALWRSW
jgi:hypothetical protein